MTSSLKNSLEPGARPISRSQSVTSSFEDPAQQHGGSRYMPFAFTESGVAMLSCVLHSQRAIKVNIEIMIAFTKLRKQLRVHQIDLNARVDSLERKFKMLSQNIGALR